MSERLLYHLEITNKDRREGDEEIHRMLDTLSARLDGVDHDSVEEVKKKLRDLEYRQAGAARAYNDRIEALWTEVTQEMDNRVRSLSIKWEERFEALEEGLRDAHDDFTAVNHRLTRSEKHLASKVRGLLVLLCYVSDLLCRSKFWSSVESVTAGSLLRDPNFVLSRSRMTFLIVRRLQRCR